MSGSTQDETINSATKPPMPAAAGSKGSHKRNLSNGTLDNSPSRRSKRQKSTANLKEISSEESEAEAEAKTSPTKTTRTKKTRVVSVKKQAIDDTELLSGVKTGQKEAVSKTEAGNISAKTETEAAATTQQKKPAKKGKKTKEEKELEDMPLAARTQGLRMFVGAHVSAAKGQFPVRLSIGKFTH